MGDLGGEASLAESRPVGERNGGSSGDRGPFCESLCCDLGAMLAHCASPGP